MNESIAFHSTKNQIFKQIHKIGKSTVISIDKSIIEKLKIDEGIFLQQEITEDGTGIIMTVKKYEELDNEVRDKK